MRWLPTYAVQRALRRTPSGLVHLMIALADHFEPAIVPQDGAQRASLEEQQRRLGSWTQIYPKAFGPWRDHEGRPFVHTYFYPAEQYDRAVLDQLSEHCRSGWGEVEIHLHHGLEAPDTAENTRRQLQRFRDQLAFEHGCLSYFQDSAVPRYAFVHGNFALGNSMGGRNCGVDSELQILADTGCYADLTLPPGIFHPTLISKINSLYECRSPLSRPAAHASGRDLVAGLTPSNFPLIVQGPLVIGSTRGLRPRIENGDLTAANPPTIRRLRLWKKAGISVRGCPNWIFIKLQCHGMDPRDKEAMLGAPMRQFLQELVEGAVERREVLHFVTAREMFNIIMAACDGREGDPGDYRDYYLKRTRQPQAASVRSEPPKETART
ncbi:MAG TPA: hypothetical protein VFI95_13185 [Terriglobales bacterium]|nr:hypothetical protein [Terriglobales bacterium]